MTPILNVDFTRDGDNWTAHVRGKGRLWPCPLDNARIIIRLNSEAKRPWTFTPISYHEATNSILFDVQKDHSCRFIDLQ